ncbi:hypothetical protein [Polaromonas sp. OV174]|nr:hypothetical protein [Polaromonas sp. OV174]
MLAILKMGVYDGLAERLLGEGRGVHAGLAVEEVPELIGASE